LAELVRRDGIDILVDLTVHMAHNRLLAFARRPAPVQVTWLGYPATTGMSAMDYRLSDPHLDPVSTASNRAPAQRDELYAEQTVRLPDSFWCYEPLSDGPTVNEPPAQRNGFITFGCLNNFCKVTGPTIKLWATVLTAAPDSRMLVLAPRGPAREHLLEKLQRNGVAPTRIEFADRCPRAKYLELYRRIDIGLDTFPYNGHTTTLDALWMGVPVVTVVGRTAVGRGGWSQLSNLGLKDLAARSSRHFARVASGLAHDRERLASLRSTLRARLARSPLMDAPRFARNIEAAYRQMWRAWTDTQSRPIAIPA
jgi:predicted O-linked N-acetylglucosamine transferase (SPINDLY family)